jgi:hypothetical protein
MKGSMSENKDWNDSNTSYIKNAQLLKVALHHYIQYISEEIQQDEEDRQYKLHIQSMTGSPVVSYGTMHIKWKTTFY